MSCVYVDESARTLVQSSPSSLFDTRCISSGVFSRPVSAGECDMTEDKHAGVVLVNIFPYTSLHGIRSLSSNSSVSWMCSFFVLLSAVSNASTVGGGGGDVSASFQDVAGNGSSTQSGSDSCRDVSSCTDVACHNSERTPVILGTVSPLEFVLSPLYSAVC